MRDMAGPAQLQRTAAVVATAVALSVLSIAGVIGLIARASSSRDAHLKLTSIEAQLSTLQAAPWSPLIRPDVPLVSRKALEARERPIVTQLERLSITDPAPSLKTALRAMDRNFVALERVRAVIARHDPLRAATLLPEPERYRVAATRGLRQAGAVYNQRAARSLAVASAGSGLVISLLLAAFSFFFLRSTRARQEAQRLAAERAQLAHTDALTGLGNRRALTADLTTMLATQAATPHALVIYDLDGFKYYNDTFGHPAGDALLARLADRLMTACDGLGTPYRMGGDEFCVLARLDDRDEESIARIGAGALTESGAEFDVGCSYGLAALPSEATSPEAALTLADRRMYAQKHAGRASVSRQTTDVLLKVLSEQSSELGHHIDGVARLAQLTALRLGLDAQDVHRIRLAAELHDVGKTAIPAEILNKKGPLDEEEWRFMRRHTLIGERIIMAAPALAPTARLVRSSHERIDGTGYPDQLAGDDIPLGSRIVSVCDAFDAMVSERPYSKAIPVADAMAELRRCSGTQFDAEIVRAFAALVAEIGYEPEADARASVLDAAA